MNKRITAGDWRVEADKANEGRYPYHSFRFVTSTADGGVTICQMMDSEHMAADAHLIAIAPELLAMNARLAEALDDALAHFPVTTQTDQVRYQQMRALLTQNQKLLLEVEAA